RVRRAWRFSSRGSDVHRDRHAPCQSHVSTRAPRLPNACAGAGRRGRASHLRGRGFSTTLSADCAGSGPRRPFDGGSAMSAALVAVVLSLVLDHLAPAAQRLRHHDRAADLLRAALAGESGLPRPGGAWAWLLPVALPVLALALL